MEGRFEEMTQAPLKRLIMKMALPGIVSMVVSALYNMADTYFVGYIGTSATGAVGVVYSLMALIMGTGLFFGHGSGNSIARSLGARREEEAAGMLATGFFSCLLVSALIGGAGLLFLEPLARILGATDTILPHACAYMRYILLGAPFMAASLTLNNQLRCQGNPRAGMFGIAAGAVLNIGLDPLLIFRFNMGTAGAGLATMLSQMVSFAILLFSCGRGGNLRLRGFRPQGAQYREIVRTGFPSFARQMLTCVAALSLNHAAGVYGDAAIAAMAIVSRTMSFINSTILGFGQGYQPVCGFNFGARRYDRVLAGYRFCVTTALIILAVVCALCFAFAEPVMRLFRDDPAVAAVGVRALRLQCACFPLMGYVVVTTMLFQSIGEAGRAAILAVARQGLFFLPALYFLSSMGLLGIQLAQPVSDVLTFLLALPLGLHVTRGLKRAAARSGENAEKGKDEAE